MAKHFILTLKLFWVDRWNINNKFKKFDYFWTGVYNIVETQNKATEKMDICFKCKLDIHNQSMTIVLSGQSGIQNCYRHLNGLFWPAVFLMKNNNEHCYSTLGVVKSWTSKDRCRSTTWWRHQMETFSALLTLCAGNSPVPGEFPAQRQVARSVDVFFDLRLNKRLSKQSWGWWSETPSSSLWRHRNETTRWYQNEN